MSIFTGLRPLEPIYDPGRQAGAIAVGDTPPDPCPAVQILDDWSFGSSGRDMIQNGSYIYTTSSSGHSFVVVDATNPEGLQVVGALIGAANGINRPDGLAYLAGDVVLMCSPFDNSLTAIDVSTPREPTIIDTLALTGATRVLVDGTQAYVGASPQSIYSVDCSTPSAMVLDDTLTDATDLGYASEGLALSGNHLFAGRRVVGFTQGGLASVDISTPTSLSIDDTVTFTSGIWKPTQPVISGSNVFVLANVGFQAWWIVSVDITNPSAMSIDQEFDGTSIMDLAYGFGRMDVDGSLLYVGGQDSSPTENIVARIDISTPTALSFDSEVRVEDNTFPAGGPLVDTDVVFTHRQASPGGIAVIRKACFA